MSRSARLSICFHRFLAYGFFFPESGKLFGGAEVRAGVFAQALAARSGFNVYFIVGFQRQTKRRRVGQLTTIRAPFQRLQFYSQIAYEKYRQAIDWNGPVPAIRFDRITPDLFWNIPLLAAHKAISRVVLPPRPRRFYRDLNCDVFCCFGTNKDTADIIASGKKYGFKTVLFLVVDHEASADVARGNGLHPMYDAPLEIIRYNIMHADVVIAQTQKQAAELTCNFNRDCQVIRNPLDLSLKTPVNPLDRGEYVFWIGRSAAPAYDQKQPHLCLELARRCPEIPFLAIINPFEPQSFRELVAAKPNNLTILDFVPFHEVEGLFRRAAIHISTSFTEGFPNSFLQAAKFAKPTISLNVDPDGMLAQKKCGVVCGNDLELMTTELRKMWENHEYRSEFGRQGRAYVESEHDLNKCTDQLENLLSGLGSG